MRGGGDGFLSAFQLPGLRPGFRSANRFPGFEADIQGLFRGIDTDGTIRFYTYVMRE